MLVFLRSSKVVLVLILALVLAACTGSSPYKAVYEQPKEKEKPLEVPPDLIKPQGENVLSIPSIVSGQATYSSYRDKDGVASGNLLPEFRGVQMKRDGMLTWLEFNTPAEKIWPKLKAYFKSLGFEIKSENLSLGVMETGWLENRMDVPTNWFSKLLKKIYSTGLQDKYRARLERDEADKTLLFIRHQGMKEEAIEVIASGDEETVWVYRDPDPELEAEMLMRFMLYSGMEKEQAEQLVKADVAAEALSIVKEVNGAPVLDVKESFTRTWRRVSLALDRLGLLIEDRNRSAGVYYIKLSKEFRDKEKKGWLESLFESKSGEQNDVLILKLDDENDHVLIKVRGREGKEVDNKLARLLLSELQQYLR